MNEFKGFKKGVNLGGWLSQCDYSTHTLETFICEEDLRTIAGWGADHVRLPIDYNIIENEAGFIESGFVYIERGVEWARKNGLNIILDLHKTAGFMFDKYQMETGFFEDEALQERFYRLWEEFARRFGNDPEHVAFELLNEVTDKEYSRTWNRITRRCIERIRRIAPETVILVGSYWNNSVTAVKDLDEPHDERIVYNFHCYDPLKFTHQNAPWVDDPEIHKTLSFDESGVDAAYFEGLFAEAIEKAAENDTVLYCGEYGVIDQVPAPEAMRWMECIHEVFEKHNIGRCIWSYKRMDFGLADERFDGFRDEAVKLL